MSTEEEIELKDLIMQTLEANGCLPKIKAQLRSSLYLSLHEDIKVNNLKPLINKKAKEFLETADGKIMFCIVREFLEFFALDFTLSVYETESYLGQNYEGRSKLIEELGLCEDKSSVPVLLELIRSFKGSNIKTALEMEKSVDVTENDVSKCVSDKNASVEGDKVLMRQLNSTFVVNKDVNIEKKDSENIVDNNDNEANTYEDTYSLVEEDVSKSNTNVGNFDECDTDTSLKNSDKAKNSQKTEKVKTKNAFSCLPDVSPLQHKSRVSDILPSLYNKELKEKSNLQELDKMFDMEAEYEEDFICSGQDLSESYLTSDTSKNIDLEDDLKRNNSTDVGKSMTVNSCNDNSIEETVKNEPIIEET